MPGHLGAHDRELARGIGIADPMVEAASLERVVDFAGAVRGDDDDRRMGRLHRAELGDGDLVIGEHLEEKRLERLVGAVELVDQEHRRAVRIGLERLEQRPLDQEILREHVVGEPVAVDVALRLGEADRDHLRGVVPFIDGGGDVESLVALQPDQPPAERRREHLGDLGLADPRLAFEEQRPPHAEREKQHRRQRPVGEVFGRREQRQRRVDGCGDGRFGNGHEQAFRQDISGRSAAKREGPGGMTGIASPSPSSGRAGWGLNLKARRAGGRSKSPTLPSPKTGRERRLTPARQRRRGVPARPPDGRGIRRCRGCRSPARRRGSTSLPATSARSVS